MSLWHSIGEAAYQEVPHLHIHVHPRWLNDGMLQPYPARPRYPERVEMGEIAERIRARLDER